MSTYTPEVELRRRVINLLLADATLTHATTGLLYPATSPKVDSDDLRIHSTGVDIPGAPTNVSRLPRINVDTMAWGHGKEQEQESGGAIVMQAGVKLWTHTAVDAEDEQLGAAIDARIRTLLLSTWLTDARIITPRLALDGNPSRSTIEGLNGAWDYMSGFSTPNVGSLQ